MHHIPPPAVNIKDPLLHLGRMPILVDFTRRTDWNEDKPNWKRVDKPEQGNCWSSSSIYDPDMHLPCFDVDVALTFEVEMRVREEFPEALPRWVPSTTEGHHHVYVDHAYTWFEYTERLDRLRTRLAGLESLLPFTPRLGVVDRKYIDVSHRQGATHVRFPHVKKLDSERGSDEVPPTQLDFWSKAILSSSMPILGFDLFTVKEAPTGPSRMTIKTPGSFHSIGSSFDL